MRGTCGHDNRDGAKFCDQCGLPLGAAARSAAPASYTPRHLVEKILQSRSALEGERKQVTVLFADVQGSMHLAEQVDPEAWHRIMDHFFAIMTEGVHRFEGTINQYTGDGVMALFGAPLAHEDHAQRACYAALHLQQGLRAYAQELRREHGLQLSVRMGLNSGSVVVGKIGDDLRMDYTAQGATVGLAARMEQLAEPGRTYLSARTAALVEGFFALEDLHEFTVKGVSERLRVYALQGVGEARTRFDAARLRGFSRFIGRADELAALEAALARAAAGEGPVVGLAADAGVGKSRLCDEFSQRCRARRIPVYAGHAVAHGRTVPFLPVIDLFRSLFGIVASDGDEQVRTKIAGTLLRLDERLRDRMPALFDLLGVSDTTRAAVPLDPDTRQRQLLAAARLFCARSEREPLVILIEDLHWIDAASEAFLAHLVQVLVGSRALLLLNFRPQYRAPWAGDARYQQIALQPFGPAAVTELLRDLLGGDATVAPLAERIREHTGGNPFFIEEMVLALAQNGSLSGVKGAYRVTRPVAALAMPATVEAVLAARIDRLSERDKALLQMAAVIGKRFAGPLLEAVADASDIGDVGAALTALQEAELIFAEALYPTAEYAFRHPLTQEVAYGSQLGDRRQRAHAAVARAVAELHADKLDERAALLAHHWERAGAPLEAARWHRRAADWVVGSDAGEALRHLRAVLAQLAAVPESPETVALELETRTATLRVGSFVGLPPDEAAAVLAAGRALAERHGGRRALADLLSSYGVLRMMMGDVAAAQAFTDEAAALAQDVGDATLQLDVLLGDAQTALWSGRLAAALEASERAVALFRQGQAFERGISFGLNGEAFAVAWRGFCLAFMGRVREALVEVDRTVALAREAAAAEGLCVALNFRAVVAYLAGDHQMAARNARAALAVTDGGNALFRQAQAHLTLGMTAVADGEYGVGLAWLEMAREEGRAGGMASLLDGFLQSALALAYAGTGEVARGRAAARESIELARQSGGRISECPAHLADAETHTAAPTDRAAVEQALQHVQGLIEETGARVFLPRLHAARAGLAEQLGDEAARLAEWERAERAAAEMDMHGLAAQYARRSAAAGRR